jgi:hypothetical protein
MSEDGVVNIAEYAEATSQRRAQKNPRTTVNDGKCGICRTHRALTGSGQLYALAVRGPKRDYVRYICEDCVGLFNTTHWAKARKALKTLRPKRYGLGE